MRKISLPVDQNHPAIVAYKEAVDKGSRSLKVVEKNGQWFVCSMGSGEVSESFSTKEEARNFAEATARQQKTAFFVFEADHSGTISERQYFDEE